MRTAMTALGLLLLLGGAAPMSADNGDWRRISEPQALVLPRDHGAHPDVRTEWWYLTANVEDDRGRRYGVQVTFFRQGVDPSPTDPADAPLRARHAVAAHLAVTDVGRGQLRHAERLRRADQQLAGFSTTDLDVWVGDWRLVRRSDDTLVAVARARDADLAVALELTPRKPLVLHGDAGWSRKGPEAGNASSYTSWTRLEVTGRLEIDGRPTEVTGSGWFDHEWGTSQLGEGVVGWDWFSLRLDGGSELMVYRLRTSDGGASRFSSGSLVDAAGRLRRLSPDEVNLSPTGRWTSPETGAVYPSGWRIEVPSAAIDVMVDPEVRSCEIDGRRSTGVVYWEGPVVVSGTETGAGYVELTGYAGELTGLF